MQGKNTRPNIGYLNQRTPNLVSNSGPCVANEPELVSNKNSLPSVFRLSFQLWPLLYARVCVYIFIIYLILIHSIFVIHANKI